MEDGRVTGNAEPISQEQIALSAFGRVLHRLLKCADDQMLPHVEDLAALLEGLGAEPTHLVGNSWGAFIALLAAIHAPERVRSLVLMEPPVLSLFVSTPPRPAELAAVLARRPRTGIAILGFGIGTIAGVERALKRGEDERAMERFARGVLGDETFENLPEERLRQARDNIPTLRAQQLGAGFPPLSEHEVRSVRIPALLICGERSPGLFRRLSERLEELLPKAEMVQIDDASHAMHEQQPAAVNGRISRFLAGVSGGGGV
jgi:pimeloyl-ACP methyl ester carboxylesterase